MPIFPVEPPDWRPGSAAPMLPEQLASYVLYYFSQGLPLPPWLDTALTQLQVNRPPMVGDMSGGAFAASTPQELANLLAELDSALIPDVLQGPCSPPVFGPPSPSWQLGYCNIWQYQGAGSTTTNLPVSVLVETGPGEFPPALAPFPPLYLFPFLTPNAQGRFPTASAQGAQFVVNTIVGNLIEGRGSVQDLQYLFRPGSPLWNMTPAQQQQIFTAAQWWSVLQLRNGTCPPTSTLVPYSPPRLPNIPQAPFRGPTGNPSGGNTVTINVPQSSGGTATLTIDVPGGGAPPTVTGVQGVNIPVGPRAPMMPLLPSILINPNAGMLIVPQPRPGLPPEPPEFCLPWPVFGLGPWDPSQHLSDCCTELLPETLRVHITGSGPCVGNWVIRWNPGFSGLAVATPTGGQWTGKIDAGDGTFPKMVLYCNADTPSGVSNIDLEFQCGGLLVNTNSASVLSSCTPVALDFGTNIQIDHGSGCLTHELYSVTVTA